MRASIDDLMGDSPLSDGLPAVYHREEFDEVTGEPIEPFVLQMLSGFDQVLAPVHAVVRDLDSYFDPAICPVDFLDWIASWLGVELSDRWPLQRRRVLVQRAVQIHRMRGTAWGIERAIELYTGVLPEVSDSGGCTASGDPSAAVPGAAQPFLRVIVRTDDASIDPDVVDRIIAATKPALVPHEVQVIRAS